VKNIYKELKHNAIDKIEEIYQLQQETVNETIKQSYALLTDKTLKKDEVIKYLDGILTEINSKIEKLSPFTETELIP
jgi:hypothetical protein